MIRGVVKIFPFVLAVISPFAHADDSVFGSPNPTDPSIELGGGVLVTGPDSGSNSDSGVDVLVRVNFQSGRHSSESRFVWIKLRGDLGGSANGVGYVDVQLDAANFETGATDGADDFHVGLSMLSLRLQRDIRIGNDLTARLTILGLRAGGQGKLSERVHAFIEGSMDILGLALSRRVSDGTSDGGIGFGVSVKAGLEISGRYRVTVGEDLGYEASTPITINKPSVDQGCVASHQPVGSCYRSTTTYFGKVRTNSTTYLNFTAALTRHLAAYGQANFNLYAVTDDTGAVPGSTNVALEFMFGVLGRF